MHHHQINGDIKNIYVIQNIEFLCLENMQLCTV